MKILIACEFSGIVREAFKAKGHNAWSCDLLDTEIPGQHIKGNVLEILNDGWDMGLFFTPCTYSCNSGIRWMYNLDKTINQERYKKLQYYAGMIKTALNSNIPKVGCENPIPHRYAIEIIGRKYDQIIQPWQFGHGETKATCLWLKNLPLLKPENIVEPDYMRKADGSYYKDKKGKRYSRIHFMSRNMKDRSKIRSLTYQGIANAFANQYG